MADETCRAFDSQAPFDPGAVHRFVVGADPVPRRMSPAEIKSLGDPFATLLLAKGKLPRTAEQVIGQLKSAAPKNGSLRTQRSFVLGEGSQLASTAESEGVDRTLRFVVTLGRGPDGPDVFLSIGNPAHPSGIEVMAWDREVGGFNYYRSTGTAAMWMFAGNSRDALKDASRGKGPFESHPSGALLMKELKAPWTHWDSPDASIEETVFARGDKRRTHPWFKNKDPGGALAFQFEAAEPSMQRWARARFEKLRKNGGPVTRPKQIMDQILGTPTVNLTSSSIASRGLPDDQQVFLPSTFFVDADCLSIELGLDFPPPFEVSGKIYKRCLEKFDVRVEDGQGFKQKGDTHFCFLVPERAFEDRVVLREALSIGLITKRLATCLLMVDPWNPVFSTRRQALLQHVPATATIANGKSTFSKEMADTILAAAELGPADAPEAEFAERWETGAAFTREANKLLKDYFKAVTAKLKTQAGFDPIFQLAEERRARFGEMPIAEFPLLLPLTNVNIRGRVMRQDASVGV